jgi:hypothetical protein
LAKGAKDRSESEDSSAPPPSMTPPPKAAFETMAASHSVPEGLMAAETAAAFEGSGTAQLPPDSASQSLANTRELDMSTLFHEDSASGLMRGGKDAGLGDPTPLGETAPADPAMFSGTNSTDDYLDTPLLEGSFED